MAVPMDSILEELRSLDGELFKSELVQRLYLILKIQAATSIRGVWDVTKNQQNKSTYAKALSFYAQWSPSLKEEELRRIRVHRGVDELWLQVAMLYVKLSHKTPEARTVRIKTPLLEDLLEQFFVKLAKSHFCETGELWSYDAVKLDYALREIFRHAIICSVTTLETVHEEPKIAVPPKKEEDDEIYPDDSISSFLDTKPRTRFNADKEYIREPEPELKRPDTESEEEDEEYKETKTVYRDGGRSDDGATVIMRRNMDDGATIAGKPKHHASSVISSSTRSSDSSRFSRLQPAKVVTLSKPPLVAVDEIVLPRNESESEEEEEKRPITVSFQTN